MTGLANILGRIPRVLLFAIAGLIQVGLIALMVVDRVRVLRDGAEVTLQVRPVDPRDFLRGDYVVLSYDISALAAGPLEGQPANGRQTIVFVKLASKEGFYQAISVHAEAVPVGIGEKLIAGRVINGANCGANGNAFCGKLQLRYGIERYFVPEGEGLELERARNRDKVWVVVALTPSGRAAIKRLLLEGKPVYEEPYF